MSAANVPTPINTPRPAAWGYKARLNDLYVRLVDTGDGYLLQTDELDERQYRIVENPEDVSTSTGLIYSRSDFSGGEGLAFAHRRDNAEGASTRFFDSTHIDIRQQEKGEPPSFCLLPATRLAQAATASRLAATTTALFATDGTTVRRSTDLVAFASEDPHAGQAPVTVADICELGGEIYVALGASGIHRRDSLGVWTHWSDLAATRIWSVKDRIVASDGAGLYAARTDAASELIYSLPSGHVWNDVADAGEDLVAVASNGRMYFLTVGQDLALSLAAQVATPNEVPTCVAAVHDTLFWGTSQTKANGSTIGRLWRATLAPTTSTFVGASVIREWDDATGTLDCAPRALFPTRDSMFTGILEATRDGPNASLWRYDLPTGARYRHLDAHAAGQILDIVRFDGRLVMSVADVGLTVETPDIYEQSGVLTGPLGDLFSAQPKTWVGGKLEILDLNDGEVELRYTNHVTSLTTSNVGWVSLVRRRFTSDTAEVTIPNNEARFIAGRVIIKASKDRSRTPVVASFSFRAYPSRADMVVQLPVLVSDRLELPGRRRTTARGLGDAVYAELVKMEDGFVELELLDTGDVLRGRIRQISHVMEITDRRGRPQTVSVVGFVGRRIKTFGASSYSDASLGVGLLGVGSLGGVETT